MKAILYVLGAVALVAGGFAVATWTSAGEKAKGLFAKKAAK